jgi:glucose/mannose-6-phosphate isomerase
MPEDKLSPQEIERSDPKKVYALYDGWPADAEDALKTQVDLPRKRYDRVIYLAIGGSATGGDIVSDWFLSSGGVPVTVYRGNVPKMNPENALIIVCSTSGDTRETLQMADIMSAKRPDMVAISSGGKLMELAEREGMAHVRIKLTEAPRFTLPYSLFASVAVLRCASLLDGMEWEVDESLSTLREISRRINKGVPMEKNPSKQVAAVVNGRVPCIYTTSASRSVARRFKNSLNENAKMLATYAAAPDFLHNEVEMWEKPDGRLQPIFLHRSNDPPPETKALAIFGDALRKRGVEPRTVDSTGRGNLAQLMSLCYTLDVASYYAAILKGVEPFGIGLIDELKAAR